MFLSSDDKICCNYMVLRLPLPLGAKLRLLPSNPMSKDMLHYARRQMKLVLYMLAHCHFSVRAHDSFLVVDGVDRVSVRTESACSGVTGSQWTKQQEACTDFHCDRRCFLLACTRHATCSRRLQSPDDTDIDIGDGICVLSRASGVKSEPQAVAVQTPDRLSCRMVAVMARARVYFRPNALSM